MAQARQNHDVLESLLNEHDAEVLGIRKKRSTTYYHINDWAELNALALAMQAYDAEYGKYLATLKNDFYVSVSQIYTTLEALLLPNKTTPQTYEQAMDAFYKAAQGLASKAIEIRNQWSWSDANEKQYNEASQLLKKVGDYVERKIIAMPWSAPVSEKAYLLTALKKSPEALFEAQKDVEIQQYVKELNEAKVKFPEKALREDGSNLSDQVKEYTDQLEAVEAKFKNVGSTYLQQIQQIEATRKARWGIANFFVDVADFLMGNESEKAKIKRYQNRKEVVDTLEKSYSRFSKEARPLKYRADLNSLGRQLLRDASRLDMKQLNDLRIAITQLLKMHDSVQQIHSLMDDFKAALLAEIENEQASVAILAKQFEFIAERLVHGSKELNAIRLAVIERINTKLNELDNPAEALQFVNKIKTAKAGCLDMSGKLLKTLTDYENDFKAWNDIVVCGPALMSGLIDEAGEVKIYTSMRVALVSKLPLVKQAAIDFDTMLRERVIETITALKECRDFQVDHLASLMERYLTFYASPEMHVEEELLTSSKNMIRDVIRKSFDNMTPADAIAYINKWEKLETAFNYFDSGLYQEIQNKKNQYKSVQLLNAGWNNLLSDFSSSKMTGEETDKFIAAVLWLDKPNHESVGIADLFQIFNPSEQSVFRAEAKEKIAALKEVLEKDLATLAVKSLTDEKAAALGRRLTFLTKANAMYTRELGQLRDHVLKTISRQLNSALSIQDTNRYLTDLMKILPAEFKSDRELSDLIINKKEKIVKSHFTSKQAAIYKEYKSEIDFLKTGDVGLWDKIKLRIKHVDRRELTPQNIQYWRHEFLEKYDGLRKQCELAVLDAPYRAGESVEDKKIINSYLNVLIARDIESVSGSLIDDLIKQADLRRKQALAKLDKIFKLEPDKPVDLSMFTFRYFAVAEYQRHCRNNPDAVKAGSDFVRKFHDMAQNSGGFTTGFVARLPYDVLEQMYQTWSENPGVSFAKDTVNISLSRNIIGKVEEDRDTHIQVPQYLMLYMVLELIAADFDALLQARLVDESLLIGRIKFAIPHLRQLLDFENDLNKNNDGNSLRNGLLSQLISLHDQDIDDIKGELIADLQNPEINILDIVRNFPEDVTCKLPEGTADMVRQLQYRFAERYRTVMVKLLDQKYMDCMDDCVPNGMLKVNPEDKKQDASHSYVTKALNLAGGLFASKKPAEPEYEYKPSAKERIEGVVGKLSYEDRREMIQQLMPAAKNEKVNFNTACTIFGSSMPIDIQNKRKVLDISKGHVEHEQIIQTKILAH